MKLNLAERQGPVWGKIAEHLEARLQILRAKNDTDLDYDATQRLRGRIEEVKLMLELGKPPIDVKEKPVSY